MNERLDRFTKLLKEIFELDKSDLDFGIYRVMNLRKAQIEQFLTERLPKMVQETLAPFAQGSKEEIRAKMKQIEESVAEMGMTVDALPNTAQKKQQYLQLQKQLAEGADLAALETDVYSALYSFFNRYYEDGDFISKRRYKEGVYAIPYEGEEVKLYWANQDQYYIKTSENFKDYTFVFDGINVHFRLVDATTEQNNNKESKDNKRAFMLFREDEEIYPGIKTFEYDPDTAEIVIRFVYDIYNLQSTLDPEQKHLYLVGCLLSFYQQMKLFEVKTDALREFRIEKPLLVFVGNRVTAPVKSSGLSQAEKNLLTDVEEVLLFLNKFLNNRAQSMEHILAVLNADTNLVDASGRELFYQDFRALQEIFGLEPDPAVIFSDILRIIFNTDGNADEPRLRMENIRQVTGEIGLKVGEYGDYFGVINIGDTSGLMKSCEQKGIIISNEEFVSESLFRHINTPNSKIKILIGSRKFTEGWNSWRVSTMGLINFAKGEGSQAIQLFGRGVRLKGYNGCLKRSRKLDTNVTPPKHIELLETLTIFGVKAQYMEDFKSYLEQEGTPTNETIHEYRLPVISRFDEVKEKKLHVIKVKDGANFKQQAARLILDKPDQGFLRYLLKSKTVIDCRSKIQTIDSTYSFKIESMLEPRTLPADILPLLDVQRIFDELQAYKSERRYFNISIVKDKLLDILRKDDWYGLLIPQNHLEINSIAKLEAATDYAVMALKSYMDKFFKYEKERWEVPRLEYAILDADNSNFVDEYTLTYAQQSAMDPKGDELDAFVAEMSAVLQANNGLDVYKKNFFRGKLVLFDFRSHLYAPLICLEKSNLKIQLAPVALNTDEMRFVDYLKSYVDDHAAELAGKSLYLLRNKSKVGMGFFEAGNFYPDYILWIDTPATQYISFIDPKGLMHIRPDDPKIEFHKTIKDLETRLSPTADGKRIVLNSFIMAGTRSSDLRMWWSTPEVDADRAYREARNVYTLDNDECVESMMRKILQ